MMFIHSYVTTKVDFSEQDTIWKAKKMPSDANCHSRSCSGVTHPVVQFRHFCLALSYLWFSLKPAAETKDGGKVLFWKTFESSSKMFPLDVRTLSLSAAAAAVCISQRPCWFLVIMCCMINMTLWCRTKCCWRCKCPFLLCFKWATQAKRGLMMWNVLGRRSFLVFVNPNLSMCLC